MFQLLKNMRTLFRYASLKCLLFHFYQRRKNVSRDNNEYAEKAKIFKIIKFYTDLIDRSLEP